MTCVEYIYVLYIAVFKMYRGIYIHTLILGFFWSLHKNISINFFFLFSLFFLNSVQIILNTIQLYNIVIIPRFNDEL